MFHAWRWNRIRASTACSSSSICWSRCSLEIERSKQRTLGMEDRSKHSKQAPCPRGYGIPVWPRVWRGRPGSSGAARSSARGVAAASSVWRAEWRGRRGRGIGEERKEEDGSGIYMPRPFTPGAIPPPGVKVLYSRCVLPTTPGW